MLLAVELRMMRFVVVKMRKCSYNWTTPQQYLGCHAEKECFIQTNGENVCVCVCVF